MFPSPEGYSLATIQPDEVLPVSSVFHDRSSPVPGLGVLILHQHSAAEDEGKTLASVSTLLRHPLNVPPHLTLSLT